MMITPQEEDEWAEADRQRAEWEAANPYWRNPRIHAIWKTSKDANELMAKIEKLQPRFQEVADRITSYLQEHYPDHERPLE